MSKPCCQLITRVLSNVEKGTHHWPCRGPAPKSPWPLARWYSRCGCLIHMGKRRQQSSIKLSDNLATRFRATHHSAGPFLEEGLLVAKSPRWIPNHPLLGVFACCPCYYWGHLVLEPSPVHGLHLSQTSFCSSP